MPKVRASKQEDAMRESNYKGRTYQGKPVNVSEGIDQDKVQTPRKVARFGERMDRAAILAEWRKGSK